MIMDLASVDAALGTLTSYASTSSVSTGSLAYAVGLSVLDMDMELAETMNTQMTKMLESSVTPHLGGSIDLHV